MTYATLTPLTTATGDRRYASPGCTSQGDSKPVFICECGKPVVWVKSKRTDKNYIANVFAGAMGALHYRGASVHDRDTCASDRAAKVAAKDPQTIARVAALFEIAVAAGEALTAAAAAWNAYDAAWIPGTEYDDSFDRAMCKAREVVTATGAEYHAALTAAG